jgi:hypothetical protein
MEKGEVQALAGPCRRTQNRWLVPQPASNYLSTRPIGASSRQTDLGLLFRQEVRELDFPRDLPIGGQMPARRVAGVQGPAIRAIDPWVPGNRRHRRTRQLLSDGERTRLALHARSRQ